MLANENSMQNEDYAIYQTDTVVMAQKYLMSRGCPQSGQPHPGKRTDLGENHVGAKEISEFLGEKNWSKSKVASYLHIHGGLNPSILKDLKNSSNKDGKGGGLTVSHAQSLVRLKKDEQKEVYGEVQGKGITHKEMKDVVVDIENGAIPKEAVSKAIKHRDDEKALRKSLPPMEGQLLLVTCDKLIKLVKKHPLETYPTKGQEVLRKMYSQLVEILTKEMDAHSAL